MQFTCKVSIKKPINELISLWLDESNFKHWQDGFISLELIEGKKGELNSKSKITLQQGKHSMELIERIMVNDLPRERKSFVEHKHMNNIQTVSFNALSEEETECVSVIEYTEFKHLIPRIMAVLFPSMFKKQVQKWLDQFKQFAEGVNV